MLIRLLIINPDEMDKPIVSIITPCYNAAGFIELTAESVFNQTLKDWEWIIVDDCSSDNTVDIINKIKECDDRVYLLKTDRNTGTPATPRNIGIENSRGRYVALLDADDIWYPNKLEDQLNLIREKNCKIVYSNGDIIDENGKYVRSMKKQEWVDYRRTLKRNELSCSSTLLEKNIIGNLRFQTIPKEDFVFWLNLLKKTGEKAYNTNTSLYAYRIVGDSRSRNKGSIIKQQWHVLRVIERLNIIDAAYCFGCWVFRNLKKYYI